jgi:hypothetical protein
MEGTKYNLSITTSGENGDHASTNISTSNPAQLADLLRLAGMQDAHPIALGDVPQSFEAPAPEEHGSCDVCGGMHEDDEHVAEGESWDNEPNGANEVVHPPEELTQTGNDLHKVKKTYPKVNGGDNPMALEDTENRLRQQFADFLAEDYEEELSEEIELTSPWKKTVVEGEMVYVPSKEDVEGNAALAIAAIADLATEGGGEINISVSTGSDEFPPTDDEEYYGEEVQEQAEKPAEYKNMTDIRKLLDNIDSIESNGSTVVTEAPPGETAAELQAQIAALQKRIAAITSQPEGGPESGPAGSGDTDRYQNLGSLDVAGSLHGGPENVDLTDRHSASTWSQDSAVDHFDPSAVGNSGKPGSKLDFSQAAIAKRQQERARRNAEGGGPEGSSSEKYGSGRYDKTGKLLSDPVQIFTPPPPRKKNKHGAEERVQPSRTGGEGRDE